MTCSCSEADVGIAYSGCNDEGTRMQASDAWVLLTVWVLLTMKVLQFQYYRTACTEHSGHQLVPVIAGLPCTLVTASVPHCLHPSLPLHRLCRRIKDNSRRLPSTAGLQMRGAVDSLLQLQPVTGTEDLHVWHH